MLRFGNYRYYSKIQNKKYQLKLSPAQFHNLLVQENPDVEQSCKQLVYRSALDYENYLALFLRLNLQNLFCIKTIIAVSKQSYNNYYYQIDLNEALEIGLNKFVDQQGETCAYVNYNGHAYTILSSYSIHVLNPKKSVAILCRQGVLIDYKMADLKSQNSNVLKNLSIYADHVIIDGADIAREDIKKAIKEKSLPMGTASIDILCAKNCDFYGMCITGDTRIKAGFLNLHGWLECETDVRIIAQNGHLLECSAIRAKESIQVTSLTWDEGPNSCIHTPGFVYIKSIHYSTQGDVSTNNFILHGVKAHFYKKITCAIHTELQVTKTLYIAPEALFVVSKASILSSQLRGIYKGNIDCREGLKITWGKIEDPRLIPKGHVRLEKKNDANNNTRFLQLYAKHHLNLSGSIYVEDAHLSINSGDSLHLTGNVYHQSDFENYGVYIHAFQFAHQGTLQSNQSVQSVIKNEYRQTGSLEAKTIILHMENCHLEQKASIKTEQLCATIKKDMVVEKESKIDAGRHIMLRARNIIYRGILERPMVLMNADRLITLTGSVKTDAIHLISPIQFITTRLRVKEISINSIVSMIPNITWADNISINSIINFSPLLTIQTGFRLPTPLSAATMTINMALSITGMLVPGALAVTLPAGLVFNGILRSTSILQSANHTHRALINAFNNSIEGATLKAILAVNQLVTLLAASSLAVLSGLEFFDDKMNLTSKTFQLQSSDFIAVGELIASSILSSFSGNINNSMISIGPAAFLGVGELNNNLIALRLGPHLALSSANFETLGINTSYNATLGPSSSTSAYQLLAGQSISPLGVAMTTHEMVVAPIIPLPHYKLNIHYQKLTISRPTTFINSSLQGRELTNHDDLALNACLIKTQITNDISAKFTSMGCILGGHIYKNHGIVIIINSQKQFEISDNYGKEQLIQSDENSQQITTYPYAISMKDGCNVNSNNISVAHDALDDRRVCEVTVDQENNCGTMSSFGGSTHANKINNHKTGQITSYQHQNDIKNFNNFGSVHDSGGENNIGNWVNDGNFIQDNMLNHIKSAANHGSITAKNSIFFTNQLLGHWFSKDVKAFNSTIYIPPEQVNRMTHERWAYLNKMGVQAVGLIYNEIDNLLRLNNPNLPHTSLYRPDSFDFQPDNVTHRSLPPIPKWDTQIIDDMVIHTSQESGFLANLIFYTLTPLGFVAPNMLVKENIYCTGDLFLQASHGFLEMDGAKVFTLGNGTYSGSLGLNANEADICSFGTLKMLSAHGKMSGIGGKFYGRNGNDIHGETGVELNPKIVKRTESHTRWHWHGLKSGIVKTTDEEDVIASYTMVASENGKVNISTGTDGTIHAQGTSFIAPKGVYFSACDGHILLNGLKLTASRNTCFIGTTGYSNTYQYVEGTVPNYIKSDVEIEFHSRNPLIIKDTIFDTPNGSLVFDAPKFFMTTTINNNYYRIIQFGFALDIPLLNFNPDVLTPLFSSIQQISESQNLLANATRNAIEMTHEINTVMKYMRVNNQSWRQAVQSMETDRLFDNLFHVKISFVINRTSGHYQTRNTCSIQANNVFINAEDGGLYNAVELNVNDLFLKSNNFVISGATLHEDNSSYTLSLGVNVGAEGISNPSISYQDLQYSRTYHDMARPHIHHLHAEVNNLTLQNAVLNPDKVSGHINHVTTQTDADSENMSHHSFYADMDGNVGAAFGESHHESLLNKSAFNPKDTTQLTNASTLTENSKTNLINTDVNAAISTTFSFANDNPFNMVSITFNQYKICIPILNTQGMQEFQTNLQWLQAGDETTAMLPVPITDMASEPESQRNMQTMREQVVDKDTGHDQFNLTHEWISRLGDYTEVPFLPGHYLDPALQNDSTYEPNFWVDLLYSSSAYSEEKETSPTPAKIDISKAFADRIFDSIFDLVTETSSDNSDIDKKYLFSIIKGSLKGATIDILTAPYDLMRAAAEYQMLVDDAKLVSAVSLKHLVGPSNNDFNLPAYLLANDRLEQYRYESYEAYSNWLALSGPDKAEYISRLAVGFLIRPALCQLTKFSKVTLPKSFPVTKVLYRGDSRPPSDIFEKGFQARGKNPDLSAHAFEFERKSSKGTSAYISTSKSIVAAERFPVSPNANRSYIYVIKTSRPVINVQETLIPKLHEKIIHPEDYNLLGQEQEFAFFKKIKPSEIRGAWEIEIKKTMNLEDMAYLLMGHKPYLVKQLTRKDMDALCYDRKMTGTYIPNPKHKYPQFHFFKSKNHQFIFNKDRKTRICLFVSIGSQFLFFNPAKNLDQKKQSHYKSVAKPLK